MFFLRYFNIHQHRIRLLAWVLICLASLFFYPSQSQAQKRNTIRKVVIDAGHGGHDPGAMGRNAKEKNINLGIALKLGNMIQRNLKDVRVIYTRDKDYFVELHRRAEIANENKADLFICIHCNANRQKSLKGSETYVMGLHKSEANLEIAKLENSSILLETDYSTRYDGFDPNSAESYIIFSLYQNSNLDQSTEFAAEIMDQLESRTGLNNRGVRQAGFIVLYKTTMPSVLVETGYLSNSSDEAFLVSDKGQEYIATAIFRAFKNFKDKIENPGAAESTLAKSYIPRRETTQVVKPVYDSSPVVKKEIPVKKAPANGLSFRVQIASSSMDLGSEAPRVPGMGEVSMYIHKGMYKYTVGDEPTLASAQHLLAEVKRKGIKDAFIVIFRENERISEQEANRLMGKPGK